MEISEQQATKCAYCKTVLLPIHKPKLLECLHSACVECVSKKFVELDRNLPSLIHCSICNRASQQHNIIPNYFIIENTDLIDQSNLKSGDEDKSLLDIKCSSCSDDATASSWCVDCSEFICENCVIAHQRLKITKDHTIKPKEEADTSNRSNTADVTPTPLSCSMHPHEKLSLYCETCFKLTCRDCQLAHHRDHKYKFSNEAAKETRTTLKNLNEEIVYKRYLLTSALKVIDERQILVNEKKKELVQEITSVVVKITDAINLRGKQMVVKLNEVCDSKTKILLEKRETLQALWENVDHCMQFVGTAIDKGSDCALLHSKSSLAKHLQNLKCQRADIPNPEIPVRISLQFHQLNELLKVITQLGVVVVDGKTYPSPANQAISLNRPQPPSPNMMNQIRPNNMQNVVAGAPSMYPNPQQQFNVNQMPRNFPNEQRKFIDCFVIFAIFYNIKLFSDRFQSIPVNRNGQPIVSSSTHPQSLGEFSYFFF